MHYNKWATPANYTLIKLTVYSNSVVQKYSDILIEENNQLKAQIQENNKLSTNAQKELKSFMKTLQNSIFLIY
jgi:hypothetical protein